MYNLVSKQITLDAKMAMTGRAFVPAATRLVGVFVMPLLSRRYFGKRPLTSEAFAASVGA